MHLLPGLWQHSALTFPNGQITHPESKKPPSFCTAALSPPVSCEEQPLQPIHVLTQALPISRTALGESQLRRGEEGCAFIALCNSRGSGSAGSVVGVCSRPGQAQLVAFSGVLRCDRRRGTAWLLLLAGDSTFHSRGRDGLQEGSRTNPAFPNPWPALSLCSGCPRPVLNLRFLWRCQTDDIPWPILSIFLHCKPYFHILQNATNSVI